MKQFYRFWLLLTLGSTPLFHMLTAATAAIAEEKEVTHEIGQISCRGFRPYSVAVSPDGRLGLVGGGRWTKTASEGRLWLVDLTKGKELRQMDVPTGWVMGVAFSPDGRQAVSCGRERDLRIWDVTTGKELRHFSAGDERPLQWHCVAFSPDGRFIVAGGSTRDARLFDAASGKLVQRFGGHRGAIWCLAFAPDGKRLLISSHHELRLWDVRTAKSLHSIRVGNDWNSQAVFSPDGRCLLTSEMYTLILRKAETGEELRRWEGHRGNVNAAAFTPDGGQVLSGAGDGSVRLWDIETGKQLRIFNGHTELVTGIGITRDGKRLLSAGQDQTIRLWGLP